MDPITLVEIRDAGDRIAPYVTRTPTLRYAPSEACSLWLKAESLQPTGAFKLRGAFNFLLQLPEGCPGVVAHSSGNHAQAVARAARVLGIRAVVVMPDDAPATKRTRTEADGAEVIVVGPDSSERARRADALCAERGWPLVPPFDDARIAAGQGTAALELLEESGPLDRFYAPVSGGGLMAGCAVVLAELSPDAEIVAVEPEVKDALARSLAAGERRTVDPPHTLADGLRVRTPGAWTWEILREHVDRVALVSDEELLEAMRFALRELRLVLEPSGAASLAVARREAREAAPDTRWGVLLSGGNVAPELLARVAAP